MDDQHLQSQMCSSEPDSHPHERSQKSWRPTTFTRTAFVLSIFATVLLIACLAALLWQSITRGGVFFAADDGQFPQSQIFLFRYFPVVIIVFYGTLWGWVDLDVKRLEPYYQLTSSEGASAQNSLSLGYLNAFFAFVPYRSAKAKHWIVFVVSTLTILINWAVVPLQNGIFTQKTVILSGMVEATQPYVLTSLENQAKRMGFTFLADTSAILWLGQTLPRFTTRDFALAPVDIGKMAKGRDQTAQVNTTLYESELDCKPAVNVTFTGSVGGWTFDDGEGCITQPGLQYAEFPRNFSAYYVGITGNVSDPRVDYDLGGPNCSYKENAHKVLITWMRQSSPYLPDFSDPNNATALFCQQSYYSQKVNATVSLNGTVIEVERLEARQVLPDDQFNRTRFEVIVSVGSLPYNEAENGGVDSTVMRQDTYVTDLNLSIPVSTMSGLAIGATRLQPQNYLNASILAHACQSAHRLAFALAVSHITDPSSDNRTVTVRGSAIFDAVTVVPIFAIAAQVTLVIVTALSAFLLAKIPSRSSNLVRDPDCIAEQMLISRSLMVREHIGHVKWRNRGEPDFPPQTRFVLGSAGPGESPMLTLMNPTKPKSSHHTSVSASAAVMDAGTISNSSANVEPSQYKWHTVLLFCAAVAGVLMVLLALNAKASRDNGLVLPSSSDVVLQILTNILPTLVATIIEPIWIWFSRMACVLAPLDNLQHRREPARRSLSLTYAAIPPQLAMWKALRNGNIVLSALSAVAFTAGVLTVAISGIFVIADAPVTTATQLSHLYTGQMKGDDDLVAKSPDAEDGSKALFVALANMTNQVSLPSWTAPHDFFLPMSLDTLGSLPSLRSISMELPGYSVDPGCIELEQSNGPNNTYKLDFNQNATIMNFASSHVTDNGTIYRCTWKHGGSDTFSQASTAGTLIWRQIGGNPTGSQGIQLAETLESDAGELEGSIQTPNEIFCSNTWLFGWVNVKTKFTPDNNETQLGNMTSIDVSSTMVVCRPRLTTRNFNVSVAPGGIILRADPLTELTTKLPSHVNISNILSLTMENFPSQRVKIVASWRNDSKPLTTSSYLYSRAINSTSFLDPNNPAPQNQASVISDILKRMFVITFRLTLIRMIASLPDDSAIPATIASRERRIFISPASFYISVGILSIQLLVAIVFFLTRPRPYLKRLPTTVAAQLALFANSHIVDDVMRTANGDFKELDRQGWKYGYGKYVGLDGKIHEGIERAPYVRDLDMRQTSFQRSWTKLFRRGRRQGRHTSDDSATDEACHRRGYPDNASSRQTQEVKNNIQVEVHTGSDTSGYDERTELSPYGSYESYRARGPPGGWM